MTKQVSLLRAILLYIEKIFEVGMSQQREWMQKLMMTVVVSGLFMLSRMSWALSFPLPAKNDDIVGQVQTIYAQQGDTLSSLGMQYDIGYIEMLEANPDLPKREKLALGTPVIIPSQFILPSVRKGLVVNLAELRVYYFPADENAVYIFPIGAGKQGWKTPTAVTKVVRKVKDPAWTVPASIKRESARHGKILPDVVPPGPNNPLGKYALRLALPGVLIHGTLAPASVGQRSSHGCMRMLPDDIKFLYENVPVGTVVHITHEHNKVGWLGNQLYLEAEIPFAEHDDQGRSIKAEIEAKAAERPATINWLKVDQILEEQTGIPQPIGHAAVALFRQ